MPTPPAPLPAAYVYQQADRDAVRFDTPRARGTRRSLKNKNWPEWLNYSWTRCPSSRTRTTCKGAAQCWRSGNASPGRHPRTATPTRAMLDPASALLTSSPLTQSIATAALTAQRREGAAAAGGTRVGRALVLRPRLHRHPPQPHTGPRRRRSSLGARERGRRRCSDDTDAGAGHERHGRGRGVVERRRGGRGSDGGAAEEAAGGRHHHAAAARTTTTTNAVVLTTHSLIIRRLFKAMLAEESKGAGQLGGPSAARASSTAASSPSTRQSRRRQLHPHGKAT